MTKVVNLKHAKYDVYIGRTGHGKDGYFGNPFPVEVYGREKALRLFCDYFEDRIEHDAGFKERILELRDKTLGCFCKPKRCHGDIIAKYLNND